MGLQTIRGNNKRLFYLPFNMSKRDKYQEICEQYIKKVKTQSNGKVELVDISAKTKDLWLHLMVYIWQILDLKVSQPHEDMQGLLKFCK